ncbi:hypothetical protein BH10PLA1_BH10PLA1_02570 [soil metagenome]
MANRATPTWQTKLNDAIRRDPQKVGVLGVLALILIVMSGRLILTGKTEPAPSAAATFVTPANPASGERDFRASGKKDTSAAMQRWLTSTPAKIARNLFAVDLDHYPHLSGKSPISRNRQSTDEDKSAEQAADEQKDWESRVQVLQRQAGQLKIQSTMMSAKPQALINGQMVREGDLVTSDPGESQASFKVLKIEPRRIIVEHEGIRLEILMK